MRSGKLPQLPESLREQQIGNAYGIHLRRGLVMMISLLIKVTSPTFLCNLAYKALDGNFTNEEVS